MNAFCTRCGHAFGDDDRFCSKCGATRGGSPAGAGAPASAPDGDGSSGDGGSGGDAPTSGPKLGAILGLGVLLAAVPLFLMLGVFGGGSVSGQLAVTGGPRPAFTFTPTGCASMQPYGRFGANVHGDGSNDGGLYVTVDPEKGVGVGVEVPGSCKNADGTDCTVFPLTRDDCAVWDVQVEYNGVTVNDVRQVRGHAKLDCSLQDGTKVAGDLTFGGC